MSIINKDLKNKLTRHGFSVEVVALNKKHNVIRISQGSLELCYSYNFFKQAINPFAMINNDFIKNK